MLSKEEIKKIFDKLEESSNKYKNYLEEEKNKIVLKYLENKIDCNEYFKELNKIKLNKEFDEIQTEQDKCKIYKAINIIMGLNLFGSTEIEEELLDISKEEIENNKLSVSIPLITDEDIRKIDNNFENIVKEFTKRYVKEKDLVLAQYIMKKQQDKIDQLESDKQKLIEKLEEDKETLKKENADGTLQDYVIRLLEILKGEKL